MASKPFWQRPEGITGGVFLVLLLGGGALLLNRILPFLIQQAENTLALSGMLAGLAAIVYVVLDPKARNLVWYAYKSLMRWITGLFVKVDPIAILKSYIDDLENNLRNLSKQIGSLRGQMRQLKGLIDGNNAEIQRNMNIAEQAKQKRDDKNVALAARKAGRLQEANAKYDVLVKKMDLLYRVLTRMYENAEIMLDDTKDQIKVKEQEYLAIKTSHSAIRSAMSIISGDPDKRALFDEALEVMAEDLGNKVGEMERFMDTSKNLLASIDLQNGVFEEDGLRLLEEWERKSPLLSERPMASAKEKSLDLNKPPKELLKEENEYDKLFD